MSPKARESCRCPGSGNAVLKRGAAGFGSHMFHQQDGVARILPHIEQPNDHRMVAEIQKRERLAAKANQIGSVAPLRIRMTLAARKSPEDILFDDRANSAVSKRTVLRARQCLVALRPDPRQFSR